MDIPDIESFNDHGLHDIVIDSASLKSVGQSAAGWATLRPNSRYPLLESPNGTVKFYWCSETDRDAARHFRRRCQAIAIATLPSGPADKGKQTDNGRRVIAWWETDGLWMITNEPQDDAVSLSTWWTDRLVEQRKGQADGNSEAVPQTPGTMYAHACEVFAGMSKAVRVSEIFLAILTQ